MIRFHRQQLTVVGNHAIQSTVRLEIGRAFVLGWVSLEPSADIRDQLPISGFDVYPRNSAGVLRIAVGTAAPAYQREQITIQKHHIGGSDGPIDPSWSDGDRRKPRSNGSDFTARTDLGNSSGQSSCVGTWTPWRSGNLNALTDCTVRSASACFRDIQRTVRTEP